MNTATHTVRNLAATAERAVISDGAEKSDAAAALGTRYVRADGSLARTFNRMVAWSTRRGMSLWGSRVLQVRGRTSGEWRSTPVNLLSLDDGDYLVAPRGHTQWVRNLRVAGEGRLRVGRRVEVFDAVEVDDAEKPEILRSYLRRWKWEVGTFFEGVDATADDAELLAIAPGYPVFRITRRVAEADS